MELPKHFTVMNNGDLERWMPHIGPIATKLVRPGYAVTHPRITNTHELRATLRNGSVSTWGSYTLMFLCTDGGALCFDCARENYREISASIRYGYRDGWRVAAVISESDCVDPVSCDHCNKVVIHSAE